MLIITMLMLIMSIPNCFGYEMPRERSVDIDDAADYRYAAFLMHEIKQRGE